MLSSPYQENALGVKRRASDSDSMEEIGLHCSRADETLIRNSELLKKLPTEITLTIQNETGTRYLEALSTAFLIPVCTDALLCLYEPLLPEIFGRLCALETLGQVNEIAVLSAIARVFPFAPYLKPTILTALDDHGPLSYLSDTRSLKLPDLDEDNIIQLLLSLFRLLSCEYEAFRHVASPIQIFSLFSHGSQLVRYLSVRCFSIYMQFSDSKLEALLKQHLGNGPIEGKWEGRSIDYRFFSLWEERRWQCLRQEVESMALRTSSATYSKRHDLGESNLSPYSTLLGKVLVPRVNSKATTIEKLVSTPTTEKNLTKIADALLETRPVVLVGPAGCGKTSLISTCAQRVGCGSSLITLHLNEQTDSKGLVGLYTASRGTFTWQAGILTKAVTEGRWVLIEDLDRAPQEVLGLLLPLIERNEISIPSRKEIIRAAPGFRLFATLRSHNNLRGEAFSPLGALLGSRLWRPVNVDSLPVEEIQIILNEKFPLIRNIISSIMGTFTRLQDYKSEGSRAITVASTKSNLRSLLKWCRRIERRLHKARVRTSQDPLMSETVDSIFLDAIDCFVRHMANFEDRLGASSIIAQELHISPQRKDFLLYERQSEKHESETLIAIGREVLAKSSRQMVSDSTFSWTRHSSSLIEAVAAAIELSEPVLLVGETGIGKTTAVQHLAKKLGRRLTVINLSQQSESSDLLGGFKPVTTRSLALPLMEEFEDLFDQTFSSKRNQKFLVSISTCIKKQNFQRLVLLWDEALRMAETNLNINELSATNGHAEDAKPAKRRKLEGTKYEKLRGRWIRFAVQLNQLRASVGKESNKFAFAFVEGNVVQALRRGDWVLLDEINLATPDTLESILGLLDHGDDGLPSALLTESGQTETIVGHRDFRIFAAMNPATDSGKKELAPGVRSRFTELYVEAPDRDISDLVALIQTYIGELLISDRGLAPDLAHLYQEVQAMNGHRHLTDGAGNLPHFSIRTLVRALLYVRKHVGVYGLRRALYEGFSMSFLTMLSKDSELALLPVIEKFLLSSQKNASSLLRQTPRPPADGAEYVQFKHYWVAKGPYESKKETHYIITPFVQRNLLNLARALSMRTYPILLQGPTSSGKTSMVEYLARLSGHKFVRINNHEHTDLQEYLGSYASDEEGRLRYQEGVLVRALREGHWVVLDELNLAPTDVLEALNRLLDDNRELFLPETQEIVRPHPSFMLFATQNPAGLYGGRKHLSRAFRNRFLELHFDDIPEDELEFILKERAQIPPSFCSKIVSVYKKLSLLRQTSRLFEQRNSFATLRDLFRWALRRAEDREQLAAHGFMLLGERVRDQFEKAAVKAIIEETMKVKIDPSKLYSHASLPKSVRIPPKQIAWTPATIRLAVLISKAIEHNEPILLIGETGGGKTQVFQTLSWMLGKELQIVNAHVNLETGDLIGAQRPIRNRAAIEEQLLTQLQTLLYISQGKPTPETQSLESLMEQYRGLRNIEKVTLDQGLVQSIQSNIVRRYALFEWADGSLVAAMKSGDHFLLDEISLADDSVLERLNSVLESSRTILLAEKGADTVSITASPGFQFFATMNPGGDYGKRELSAALRNRLTEIWVPSLNDEDIAPILQHRLSSTNSQIHSLLLDFSKWFKQSFSRFTEGHVSLRDLLSWVEFVETNKHLGIANAVAHGAAMVYIDGIGANPTTSMTVPQEDVLVARHQCIKKLTQLLQTNVSDILNSTPKMRSDSNGFSIGPFQLQRADDASSDTDFTFGAPTTLQNAMRVVRAMQVDKPILLEGSPGVGKTTLVAALANVTGNKLTRINLSEQTDLMDLFGSDVPLEGEAAGSFAWRDGPFLRAMQNGEWVLLDEMNLASQSVLEGLNSCLDHRKQVYISELDQIFPKHPGFVLFAAQNPHQQGGGRKGLPASFVNRFSVVYAETLRENDLSIITTRAFPHLPAQYIRDVISATSRTLSDLSVDRRLAGNGGPWDINLRDVFRWLQLCQKDGFPITPEKFGDLILGRRFRSQEQRAIVAKNMSALYGEQTGHRSFYYNLTQATLQVGTAVIERRQHFIRTQASSRTLAVELLPIYEALLHCVRNNWPVILAGSSGSGKTLTIRDVAALLGAEVIEFSLNGDTDSMDLVGGFEQIDPKRSISALVEGVVADLESECTIVSESGNINDETKPILQVLHALQCGKREYVQIRETLRTYLPTNPAYRQKYELLQLMLSGFEDTKAPVFAWTDGALVQAMEKGAWIVLDNANLCNASVLDRLNSLMEPNGCLIINEQHKADGSPRLARPHANFRIFLTMDPRYGELSKAMRNRCVELYLEHETREPELGRRLPAYKTESRISRLRLFEGASESTTGDTSMIALDCISLKEVAVLAIPQTVTSLLRYTPKNLPVYSKLCSENVFGYGWQGLVAGWMAKMAAHSGDLLDNQPVNPLSNEPLLSLLPPDLSAQLETIARFLEVLLDLGILHQRLGLLHQESCLKKPTQLSVLQRSMAAQRMPGDNNRSTALLAQFLTYMIESFGAWLASTLKNMISTPGVQSEWHMPLSLLKWLTDLVCLSDVMNMDPSEFQAYLGIGSAISKDINDQSPTVSASMSQGLKLFDPQWKLCSGLSLRRMWHTWRPQTPRNDDQLQLAQRLKELASQFDCCSSRLTIPLEELADFRISLQKTLVSLLSGQSGSLALIDDLNQMLLQLQESIEPGRQPWSNAFQAEFEGLCQYLDLVPNSAKTLPSAHALSMMSILARRPTSTLPPASNSHPVAILKRLASHSGQHSANGYLAVAGRLSSGLSKQLFQLKDLSLSQISSAQKSLGLMLRYLTQMLSIITADQLSILRESICSLLTHVLSSHHDLLAPELLSLLHGDELISKIGEITNKQLLHPSVPKDHYFRGFAESFLKDALVELSQMPLTVQSIGRSLFQTSLLILHLLVPDRPTDPAVELTVARDRHARRSTELVSCIETLTKFQTLFTGQKTSIRIRSSQDQLKRLGEQPPEAPVIRPRTSQLHLLQPQFDMIVENILRKDSQNFLLPGVSTQQRSNETDILKGLIRELVSRLSGSPPEYFDLTEPIVGAMQSLSFACDLVNMGSGTNEGSVSSTSLTAFTPLLGGRPLDRRESPIQPLENADACLLQIKLNTYWKMDPLASEARSWVFELLNTIYDDWKTKLTVDQHDEAKNTRYYEYRAKNDDSEEANEADLRDMFPTYDDAMPTRKSVKPEYPPRSLAIQLAKAVTELCKRKPSDIQLRPLLNLSLEVSRSGGQYHEHDHTFNETPSMLPILLLKLDETSQTNKSLLQERSTETDFYHDADHREIEDLVNLVQSIIRRFQLIHDAWPEHATPQDVLVCCSEVLEFSGSDPLAKIITKVEKLHAFVYQWQTVSSREYSAAELLQQVTDLLVRWRRLELLSWPRLLHVERQKVIDDAQAWFLVLYETLVAIPKQIVDAGDSLADHCAGLTDTVTKFFETTSNGQFPVRLDILRILNTLLISFSYGDRSMWPIVECVSNTLEHFERYREGIVRILEDGRLKFERDIKEQIQLASWKDTNITALRESARRSHNKLFKIIRKYRTFLAKPFQAPTALDFQSTNLSSKLDPVISALPSDSHEEAHTGEFLKLHLPDWSSRPSRLTKPSVAVKTLRQLYMSLPQGSDALATLASFSESVVTTMIQLKKETPGTLTEENRESVQHLKTRKRKLLADTLRDIRHMGISRNLGTEELEKQSSLALVLATVPALPWMYKDLVLQDADQWFHALLDLMPSVNHASRECSDDLTSSELGRSVGSIQGLLHVLRRQRTAIFPFRSGLEELHQTVVKLRNLHTHPTGSFHRLKDGDNGTRHLKERLIQLLEIINVSIEIVEVQGKHSGISFVDILESLKQHNSSILELTSAIDVLPNLPTHMISSQEVDICIQARTFLASIRQNLENWKSSKPELGYLLDEILPWTIEPPPLDQHADNSPVNIREGDELLCSAVNSVFVALQHLSSTGFPASISMDELGWLSKSDRYLDYSLKALHLEEICSMFQGGLDKVLRSHDADVAVPITLATLYLPILEQYEAICRHVVERYARLHRQLCETAYKLTKSFAQLSSQGFCSPSEADDNNEQTGKLESGTGLGEGEGANDISKDVGEDEDLSEMAQQPNEKPSEEEIGGEKDAVNMNGEDLEGNMDKTGDANDTEDGDDQSGEDEDEEGDLDEEAANVDNLDPSAVDEKLWDGLANEDEKELEGENLEGQNDEGDAAAADEKKKSEDQDIPKDAAETGEEDGTESADEEGEAVGHEQPDQVDPHLEEEKGMDLPEEMQLDGVEEGQQSEISDEDFDRLSDIEDPSDDKEPPEPEESEAQRLDEEGQLQIDEGENGSDEENTANTLDEDEVMENAGSVGDDDLQEDLLEKEDEGEKQPEEVAAADSGSGGHPPADRDRQDAAPTNGEAADEAQNSENENNADESQKTRGAGKERRQADNHGTEQDDAPSERQLDAFKKLGDVLERWHRQQREILQATEDEESANGQFQDESIADAEFEHLRDEDDLADTQALGTATEDQARGLDQSQAFEDKQEKSEILNDPANVQDPEQIDSPHALEEVSPSIETSHSKPEQISTGAFVPDPASSSQTRMDKSAALDEDTLPDQIPDISAISLSNSDRPALTDAGQASRLWHHYSSIVQSLSITLTEQLRLILSPTLASKLRGDYRTGKRLNLKRIIPYIASNYKRDKIWLRRSVPSKRNYQILLAVDDSKSMAESGSGFLALETVALLCKSLSMLEVGEISVASFGNEDHIRLAHPFGTPFTNDAGPKIFQNFSYAQEGTNIRRLVEDSIALFRDARSKNTGSNAADLWQLMMIISDGICADHADIRRLIHQAKEERIMIVFIIVDTQPNNADSVIQSSRSPTTSVAVAPKSGNSILDLTSATFEPDPNSEGEMKLKIKRYLDTFPFEYYLVVRDVRELPGVLGSALRAWFQEVVDSA